MLTVSPELDPRLEPATRPGVLAPHASVTVNVTATGLPRGRAALTGTLVARASAPLALTCKVAVAQRHRGDQRSSIIDHRPSIIDHQTPIMDAA